MGLGAALMAKKNAMPTKAEPTGDDRVVIVHLKGSTTYAQWVEHIHKSTHIAKASLFRLAMADWARANGHPAPPEI